MDALQGYQALALSGACVAVGIALLAPLLRSAWKREPITLVRKWLLISAATAGVSFFVAAARTAHLGLSSLPAAATSTSPANDGPDAHDDVRDLSTVG